MVFAARPLRSRPADTRHRGVRTARVALAVVAFTFAPLVTACGSDDAEADRSSSALSADDVSQTVEFTATEYRFDVDASTRIEAGDVVRFRLTNVGTLDHEMRVLDDTGRLLDQIERLSPGEAGEVLLQFDEAGQYQLICDIDDHLTRGQQAVFSVDEAVTD